MSEYSPTPSERRSRFGSHWPTFSTSWLDELPGPAVTQSDRRLSSQPFFDVEASRFDSQYDSHPEFAERRQVWSRRIGEHASRLSEHSVTVDVGCGPGRLSLLVAERGYRCIGLDESVEMVRLAVRSAQEAGLDDLLEFRQQALPFDDPSLRGRASLVLCSSVLEYVSEPDASLASLASLLCDDGVLLLSLPNGRSRYRRFERLLRHVPMIRPSYLAWQRWTPDLDEALEACERAGLDAADMEYFASPPLPRLFGKSGPSASTLVLLVLKRRSLLGLYR